jgi:hypothetical protein
VVAGLRTVDRDGRAVKIGLAVSLAALALVGCKPSIGSRCTLSTDCSSQGDRLCDTAQSGGYCTVLNCIGNSCPDNAVCVMFEVSVPGCQYNDYSAPERTGQAMCMQHCTADSDCRQSDGYVCSDPRKAPWFAAILDDNQGQRVCIAATSDTDAGQSDAGVCALSLPPLPPLPDATALGDGGGDAATGPVLEAGSQADAATDATGSGADAGADATVDAGQVDAEGGPVANEDASDAGVTDGQ